MDHALSLSLSLDQSQSPLQSPLLDSSVNYSPSAITPTKAAKKRKHSTLSEARDSDDEKDVLSDGHRDGSGRKARPPGTKRACNQCRQQKLKCNVSEEPWADCERCKKHNLRCEITADFKRVGKRSQQAELEKNNDQLLQQVEDLSRALAQFREQETELETYKNYLRRHFAEREPPLAAGLPSMISQDDDSHDAVLLLNLKQGNDLQLSGSGARASPAGPQRKLGDVHVHQELVNSLWDEYFRNYHFFLNVLDVERDPPDAIYKKSEVLFWTVLVVASRHFAEDTTLQQRLTAPYMELIKDTISKPPNNHYVVKALCLLCTWTPPVSSTTADMTFPLSGIMMKFAMQLGLHRPSHPMDFSRTRVQLRQEDISDRLQTWAVCNLVAQNVSTGYGQPPETVYDATLNTPFNASSESYAIPTHIHTRLEIEKLADKITRTVYSPQQHAESTFDEGAIQVKAAIMSESFRHMETNTDLTAPFNRLYAYAVHLHLRLYVFFDEPNSQRYQLNLNELYNAAKSFLTAAFNCGVDLRYAPNYILQMMVAAAVALLKLLNSFFANYVDRDAGEQLFWDTIHAIRQMSVRPNDLPQRLAEVFAQIWKADAERMGDDFLIDKNKNGEIDASLTLKRRYRMSMSHVFDSIWRWKDELEGKVRAEKLEAAVKNPTSPQATPNRSSFSNGRRPSSSLMDDSASLPGMTSFGGFGGLTLGSGDMAYANSYEFFDPVGWYLDGSGGSAGLDWP